MAVFRLEIPESQIVKGSYRVDGSVQETNTESSVSLIATGGRDVLGRRVISPSQMSTEHDSAPIGAIEEDIVGARARRAGEPQTSTGCAEVQSEGFDGRLIARKNERGNLRRHSRL